MHSSLLKRIAIICALFTSLLLVPWWIGIFLGALYVLFMEHPYEIFLYGIFLDGLYGIPTQDFFMTHIFFVSTTLFFIASLWIKEHFMFRL